MTPDQRAEFAKLQRNMMSKLHVSGQEHNATLCPVCEREANAREANDRLALAARFVQLQGEATQGRVNDAVTFAKLTDSSVRLHMVFPMGRPQDNGRILQAPTHKRDTAPMGCESIG
jgi:hypothetical protein